jgi:exonuclease SbcC
MKKQLEGEPEIVDKISQLKEDISKDKEILSQLVFPELPTGLVFSESLLKKYNEQTEDLSKKVTILDTTISTLNKEKKETEIFLSENSGIPKQCESQGLRVDAIKHELKTIDVVIDAITETSRNLRERVRPSVEAHMQRILPLITAGRYKAVQLSEKYDVSVFDPDAGEFRQKEIFSGGTEDQFLLAVRISFALALLPQGKETHPEFLFLDEPLGSSDEVRREGIMNLTKTILGETFKQIFIISHVAGLEEWANQVIELDNGRVVF